jgi:hypothetical protein
MRISRAGFGAAAGALLLGSLSCVDSSTQDVTAPPAHAVTQAVCDFRTLNDLVRNYLPTSVRPQVKALLTQMEAAFKSGDLGGATNRGFDVLVFVENAAKTGPSGTPAAGSSLVNGLLACMNVGATLPVDFSQELGTGGFAVRGGPSDPTGPVLSRDSLAGIGLTGSATWPAVLGRRALLFGQPDPTATFNELLVGSAYEWSTLPVLPAVNPGAIMGFCVSNILPQLRVERVESTGAHSLLFLQSASFFLTCPSGLSVSAPGTNAAGPVGGSVKGFSDFGPVDALGINLSYLGQPSTVPAGAIISPAVRVLARGNGGTPLPEVTITLSLVTVSGTGSLSGTLTKVTGTPGVETFPDLRVSAPGTYALKATASLAGYATVVLQSANFTVTP